MKIRDSGPYPTKVLHLKRIYLNRRQMWCHAGIHKLTYL